MSVNLIEKLRASLAGDVVTDEATLIQMSRDTSIFVKKPQVVVYPKNTRDVALLVKTIAEAKACGDDVSVTARSAGTDMSGGPLTDSVVAVFTKYMNRIHEVGTSFAVTEPGVYYRDFEKETRKVNNQLLPSYPASRELAAMGGIVNNDSGGERTLEYGKTRDYVEELEVVLADGSITTFKDLSPEEVEEKKHAPGLEGIIYRDLLKLIDENEVLIKEKKPKVSKNSAGYALWDVKDTATGRVNIAKLITGAQGTLALTTKMRLRLVHEQGYRSMLVVFLRDIEKLPEIVHKVLPFNPESFESYDDQTFKLALRFLPQMLSQMGLMRAIRLGVSFLPEVGMAMRGGVPKLILMAEFSEDSREEAINKAEGARAALAHLNLETSVKHTEKDAEKYWIVRRESFALLRKNSHGLYAAPFIDDFVVSPDTYPKFLPELNALLAEYKDKFIYTVAGHIGNGNFHIIPLMDLSKPETRQVILELSPRIYELVIKYGGSTTGEHNDGIIRTPYLPMLFGPEMVTLFERTKHIFDPNGVFNPGKKVHGTFADIERDMLKTI